MAEAGNFTNENLQEMYDTLTADGAALETDDIVAPQEALTRTDNPEITQVYASLMQRSENHLRAFVRNLRHSDVEDVPIMLPADEYEMIVDRGALVL